MSLKIFKLAALKGKIMKFNEIEQNYHLISFNIMKFCKISCSTRGPSILSLWDGKTGLFPILLNGLKILQNYF